MSPKNYVLSTIFLFLVLLLEPNISIRSLKSLNKFQESLAADLKMVEEKAEHTIDNIYHNDVDTSSKAELDLQDFLTVMTDTDHHLLVDIKPEKEIKKPVNNDIWELYTPEEKEEIIDY